MLPTDYQYGKNGGSEGLRHNPVVNVTHADALAFCAWAGLRLPTAREWRWAALGAPIGCLDGTGDGHGCDHVGESCLHERRFPWGDDSPTAERCAGANPRYKSESVMVARGLPPGTTGGSTAPVVVKECALCDARDPHVTHEPRLYPARPAGASWCGAHDMVGNVEHWVAESAHVGFSYASSGNKPWVLPRSLYDRVDVDDSFSDVGFRVALSAVSR